jgi:hypothetical protein
MRGKESMPSSGKGRRNSPANDSHRLTDAGEIPSPNALPKSQYWDHSERTITTSRLEVTSSVWLEAEHDGVFTNVFA